MISPQINADGRSSTHRFAAPRQLLLRCPTTVRPVHMHCSTTVHPWTYALHALTTLELSMHVDTDKSFINTVILNLSDSSVRLNATHGLLCCHPEP